MKKERVNNESDENAKKFIKKYWPMAITVAGAAGVVGAAIWLTARYLRENKRREIEIDNTLRIIEDEVASGTNESAVILETGSYLGEVMGEEGISAADELSASGEYDEFKEAMEIAREVMRINRKR